MLRSATIIPSHLVILGHSVEELGVLESVPVLSRKSSGNLGCLTTFTSYLPSTEVPGTCLGCDRLRTCVDILSSRLNTGITAPESGVLESLPPLQSNQVQLLLGSEKVVIIYTL